MSRIETIKQQFPHLNISLLDILSELDGTKSHKYLQFLCKIFSNSHNHIPTEYSSSIEQEIRDNIETYGVKVEENKNINFVKLRILESFYRRDDINVFKKFKDLMERGLIEENDITKYSTFSQCSQAISLSEIKVIDKELEIQIFKEFEDDKWLMIRPLSFQSSIKYGAGTKWCTTFEKEKNYFFKYFHNGSLVYIINKKTGYKVALHGLEGKDKLTDISFWSAEDARTDFVDLEVDDYLLTEIRRIVRDNKTNSKFLDPLQLFEVASYCNSIDRLLYKDAENCMVQAEPIEVLDVYEPIPQPTMRA